MAHPKYRFSKQRTRTRRANYKTSAMTYIICSKCGNPVQYHRICTECGFYKGNQVINLSKK